ncbi:hypothetical protein A9G36_03120 [Gilliamella sp. Choc6-1]|uniref:hypothetical protein n=1 Tax=Gilliamella sp. Choc6-1 TaxID=3120239 RepID=UPI00080ED68F|nr:hypothetical protein [Gilliamella apicola]OCG56335.1 hypothetical protein A9G36_03120 [Gilliamella apicola]
MGLVNKLRSAMGYTPQHVRILAELQKLADHFEKSWCLQRETPLLKTKNKGEKQMLCEFENKSCKTIKVINVDDYQFELIVGYGVRVMSISKEQVKELKCATIFAIAHGSDAIVCEAVGLYDSAVDNFTDVLEFEIKEDEAE